MPERRYAARSVDAAGGCAMIERRDEGAVTVLELRHKKANALDVELLGGAGGRARRRRSAPARPWCSPAAARSSPPASTSSACSTAARRTSTRSFRRSTRRCMRLFTFPRPAVAAVNGHAMAGGWILACACDYRVASIAAGKLGLPELQVGVAFPPIAVETVRFATPPPQLQALVFAGPHLLRRGGAAPRAGGGGGRRRGRCCRARRRRAPRWRRCPPRRTASPRSSSARRRWSASRAAGEIAAAGAGAVGGAGDAPLRSAPTWSAWSGKGALRRPTAARRYQPSR